MKRIFLIISFGFIPMYGVRTVKNSQYRDLMNFVWKIKNAVNPTLNDYDEWIRIATEKACVSKDDHQLHIEWQKILSALFLSKPKMNEFLALRCKAINQLGKDDFN